MKHRSKLKAGNRPLVAKTCTNCDQFKDACHFRRTPSGNRNSWCNLCTSIQAQQKTGADNSKSQSTAVNRKNPWTDSELKKMQELREEGLSGKEIARILGRSLTAVYIAKSRFLKEAIDVGSQS